MIIDLRIQLSLNNIFDIPKTVFYATDEQMKRKLCISLTSIIQEVLYLLQQNCLLLSVQLILALFHERVSYAL